MADSLDPQVGQVASMPQERSPRVRHPAMVAAFVGVGLVVAVTVAYDRALAGANTGPATVERGKVAPVQVPTETLVRRSRAARRSLDARSFDRVASALRSAIDGGGKDPALRVELAQLLSTQALELSIRGALAPDADTRRQIDERTGVASAVLDELGRSGVEGPELRAVGARLDLAGGLDVAQDSPSLLLSGAGDPELRLALLAAPLWRDPAAPVDDDLFGELRTAEEPTVLVALLTAMALDRRGERAQAQRVVREVLQLVPDQSTAVAMLARLEDPAADAPLVVASAQDAIPAGEAPAPQPPSDAAPEPAPVPEPVTAPEPSPQPAPEPQAAPVAERTPRPPREVAPRPRRRAKPDKPEAPTQTVETAQAEGCKEARSGDADQGLELLVWAHDRRPGAPSIVICMAEANNRLGRPATALALAERVLRTSPRNKRALHLAAKIEAGKGNTKAAVGHYKALLAIDPDDTRAKAYVADH